MLGYNALDDTSPRWGAPPTPSTDELIRDAIRKEQLVKELVASQDDLRALLTKVKSVQGDVDKLASENETLQMYIDNLTMQMAKRR
ncbi:hypothetical protein BKA93DRAFT_733404 [Sparassis latifolia]